MYIEEIDSALYNSLWDKNLYAYTSMQFIELNKKKVDEVKYLLLKDTKSRFMLCVGILDNAVLCPFSSPFSMLISMKDKPTIKQYDDALKALESYVLLNKYNYIRFILPPNFYADSEITFFSNALLRAGYLIKYIDLNFQFNLNNIEYESYIYNLPNQGRKNLNIALKSELEFVKCESKIDKYKAYEVIRKNRESKNYPLRMTYEQVSDTSEIIRNDYFLIFHEDVAIAAAIVFYVQNEIAQVIYWGDIVGYSNYKPINFLAYNLIQYYKKLGFHYVDIGPSSENGIPNYGLCDFKRSIGCEVSSKLIFEKVYDIN